jgi:hypothetical protein
MTRLVSFIDGWILDQIERVSHQVQKLTGWDCLDQARFCYLLAGGFLLLAILRQFDTLPLAISLIIGLVYAICAAFYLLLSMGALGFLDDWHRRQAERGFRNSQRVEPPLQLMRVVLLFVCVAITVAAGALGAAPSYCAALALYLRACDPLPPCRGKAREWIDHMQRVPVSQGV